ncbi:MAG: CPBP family intramembrane metalloprotease [Planctomycetales bacterium]|nr:CPBP family intramembrane metalloprotease [Planctomycetales bacterium]
MNWDNVKLILQREMRDQLRDKRTLFMIVVLPIFLYPLMGMAFMQVAQFMQEHPTKVWVVGAKSLPESPVLLTEDGFNSELSPGKASLLKVTLADEASSINDHAKVADEARQSLADGDYDAVVFFPPDFTTRLNEYRNSGESEPPRPEVFFNSAKDRSRIAYDRLSVMLDKWRTQVIEQTLAERDVPKAAAQPFEISNRDVAEESGRRAAIWSKLLPFIVIIWALTGAFYPAIDLCAGEKERGTLETLLSSPAERNEIVWGKLLTIMVFSIATALLNLASLTVTASMLISHVLPNTAGVELGPPPVLTLFWLLMGLIPLAALFSALSLALAAMAKSSKEGQYYLMPLLLVTMPLATIPMMPTTEMNLGNSLVPVTGVMLLLRQVMEGQYVIALKYFVPVSVVTGACCLVAIRWAVHQFNSESVLFGESERFDLRAWLVHIVRDRYELPSAGEAFLCGVVLLVIRFFGSFVMSVPESWSEFFVSTATVQIAFVLAPVLLMAVMLTSDPRRTLAINVPSIGSILMALMLAFFLHPAAAGLGEALRVMYPISGGTEQLLKNVGNLLSEAQLWQILLLMAVFPAICEELAFRGFILSGLRRTGQTGTAIVISSVFFGVIHGILQQSISATILGLFLGYIAVQSRSVIPCMVFHMTHNSLQILSVNVLNQEFVEQHTDMLRYVAPSVVEGAYIYNWAVIAFSLLTSGLVMYWFHRQPYQPTSEERLQTALDKQQSKLHVIGG